MQDLSLGDARQSTSIATRNLRIGGPRQTKKPLAEGARGRTSGRAVNGCAVSGAEPGRALPGFHAFLSKGMDEEIDKGAHLGLGETARRVDGIDAKGLDR